MLQFVFDIRLTLRDTIFLVLMRLMTSSWIQEEMEYPLMRTISSPTYKSTQDGILWMTLSIYQARSQLKLLLLPTIYIPVWWIYQPRYDLFICVIYLHFNASISYIFVSLCNILYIFEIDKVNTLVESLITAWILFSESKNATCIQYRQILTHTAAKLPCSRVTGFLRY